MYKYEAEPDGGGFSIMDPQGDHIATVFSEEQALGLLSHLNRGK